MFDKRGGWPLIGNIIYLVFLFTIFSFGVIMVSSYKNGASLWEDFYAKEITRIINTAEPGTEVFLDVSPAVSIALKQNIDKDRIFDFDNVNNKVIVGLRPGSARSFEFFNDVEVTDWELELVSGNSESSRLRFSIKEARRDNE